MQNAKTLNDTAALVIERSFDYPVKEVFAAFSKGDALISWWPPAGFHSTVHKFDFRPGGMFLFKMENNETAMWAKLVFGRIEPDSFLECTLSFSDEQGGLTRAPFFENWPLKILNVFEFAKEGNGTYLTMKSFPVDATEEEMISFRTNRASFSAGAADSLDHLSKYLDRQSS